MTTSFCYMLLYNVRCVRITSKPLLHVNRAKERKKKVACFDRDAKLQWYVIM
jgi:hypothetical protein